MTATKPKFTGKGVRVWAETGDKTEGGFFNEKRIVETFYHVE